MSWCLTHIDYMSNMAAGSQEAGTACPLCSCGGCVFVLFICLLYLVYPVSPVSLDCPSLIDPSVFSKVYFYKHFYFNFNRLDQTVEVDTIL